MYEFLESVTDFIRIPSVSGNKDKCEQALDFIIGRGETLGFRCAKILDDRIGIIEMGSGRDGIGIFTNVDVLPAGDQDSRSVSAFEPRITDGQIFGRGSVETKGAAMAVLFAMKKLADALREKSTICNRKVRLVVGTEKFSGASDIIDYLRIAEAPEISIVTGGYFPYANTGMGNMDITFSFRLNEGKGNTKFICGGNNRHLVPEICKMVQSDGQPIVIKGRMASSARPGDGKNAILAMAAMMNSVPTAERDPCRQDVILAVLEKLNYGFRDSRAIKAGMPGMAGLSNVRFTSGNTFVPTVIRSDNGYLYLNINVHYFLGTKESLIVEKLKDFFSPLDGHIINIECKPPFVTDNKLSFLDTIKDAYNRCEKAIEEPAMSYDDAYARIIPNSVVCGPIFPGEINTSGHADEHISWNDLRRASTIYEAILHDLITEKSK